MNEQSIMTQVFEHLKEVNDLFKSRAGSLRLKPVYGGCFGYGEFSHGTFVITTENAHAVFYVVCHTATSFPMVIGKTRQEALSEFRLSYTPARLVFILSEIAKYLEAERLAKVAIEDARREEQVQQRRTNMASKVRSIPRRRKQVFDASGGKCHYCATTLTLDGKWHVDHKMPKALGGSNERTNLVASCAPCNHEKRDTTDVEFLEKRAQGAAA